MGADPHSDLVCDIAELTVSIDRAATATEIALSAHPPRSVDDDPPSPPAQQKELRRQLAALRERVAVAQARSEGPRALRAELATLLFFARTLQADAGHWRSALEQSNEELERRGAAARQERERLTAERETLVRRRDALQSRILQTAARMAQQHYGECRRTIPVFTLGDGLTVCSVSVSCPRRGLRFPKQWLVTLSRSHDVLVRRE
ncbi:MAG: hypothetical protein JO286_16455 [Solirubrobacterales bacterium]|nr:hypothetical protein [Solirubrobacterales bacterium]